LIARKRHTLRIAVVASALALVGAFASVSTASAHEGEYAKFNYCPSTTSGVFKCVQSITKGGKVVLGNKTVPIVNPVTLQGGFSAEDEAGFSTFFGATNGETLSKTPQPVPGGLAGLVNCKEISNFILRGLCELTFENGLTGVNSTLELARPASEIKISQANLIGEEGLALQLPVKVHLENPLLGSTCYIGSSSSPIIWNLTTGATSPPGPNKSIHGSSGALEIKDEGRIVELLGSELVDNAWAAPEANGCGGFPWEYLLNPIINASVGVPAVAGKNTAQLAKTTSAIALAAAVNKH
jgi:hypothetical protein